MNDLSDGVLEDVMTAERARFVMRNPRSRALAAEAGASFFAGVPMHWMVDWPTPFPLFVSEALGAHLTDCDGHGYVDFCLGDTGAMFGHSPEPVARAIAAQAGRGLTTMLPGEDAAWVGAELSRRFGLPYWQIATTASDANRFVLRWARAATRRRAIVVFDGCYHGAVDDVHVRLVDGARVRPWPGLLGQPMGTTENTRVVEFNDVAALEAALAPGDVAVVLCEPALTNIGMVLPDPDFHVALRTLTRRHGTLLAIDETHTISTSPGGYTRAFGLEPDFLVVGKPIAGGLPCAVYGASAEVAEGMQGAWRDAGPGRTGMGTTLSANLLQFAAMRANLAEVMTESAYAHMLTLTDSLAVGLREAIAGHGLSWTVTQLGARTEFQFAPRAPRSGREAEAAFRPLLEQTIHLYLLNRGVLITPFHNMMLVCPATQGQDVEALLAAFSAALDALNDHGE